PRGRRLRSTSEIRGSCASPTSFGASTGRRSSRTGSYPGPTSSHTPHWSTRGSPGASTSRTCSPPPPSVACSACRTRRSSPAPPPPPESLGGSRPWTKASSSPSSSTTRTSPERSRRSFARPGSSLRNGWAAPAGPAVTRTRARPPIRGGGLRPARKLTSKRLVCVVGAGGDRDRGKRPIMGRVASELSDLTIVTSDNPRTEEPLAIIEEIMGGVVGDAEVEVNRREAIAKAIRLARDGDVVVIAGRGAEQYQDVGHEKVPFDDREVAREVLRKVRAPA